MRKIFLQIGYPKCFSTTLQRSFFEMHPEIAYGGVGIEDNISYANEDIEYVFENLLKYANQFTFLENKDFAKTILNQFIEKHPITQQILFSSEHLVFPFSLQHIDFIEVIHRLQQVFEGYELHLIIVLRQQQSLLKSLYGEYVKMGYPETYSEFIRWVWAYRDRNFWVMLNYRDVYNRLTNIFSKHQIHLQFFEKWKENPQKQINGEMTKILKIQNKHLEIKNDNPSLSTVELSALLKLNHVQRRGMGKHIFSPFENHRNRESLKRLDAGYANDEVFANVLDKRQALKDLSNHNSKQEEDFFGLTPKSKVSYQKMTKFWLQTNLDLKEEGTELPNTYFWD